MKKVKGKKEVSKEDVAKEVIEQAKLIIKERNIKKVAHVPSGKVTWFHMQGLKDVENGKLVQAISDYLTINNQMSIHQLGELALCKFLKVKPRLEEK